MLPSIWINFRMCCASERRKWEKKERKKNETIQKIESKLIIKNEMFSVSEHQDAMKIFVFVGNLVCQKTTFVGTHTHKSQTSSNGRKANVLEHTTITSQVVQHLNRNYFNNFSYRTRACIVRAGSNKRHRTLFTFTQSAVRSEWIGGAFSMGFHSESSDGSSVQMCSCVCVCAMYILPEFLTKQHGRLG